MSSVFERAFLQAVNRRRIHHPTRLKSTIRSFHQVYSLNYHRNPITNDLTPENENDNTLDQSRDTGETLVSGEMAQMLMRKGFGVIEKCILN